MLNYSLDKEGSKNFILYFEENEDNIEVKLADESPYPPVPNTKENKNNLINKMENQVRYCYEFEEKTEKRKKRSKFGIFYDFFFVCLNIVALLIKPEPSILSLCLAGWFTVSGALHTYFFIDAKKALDDLKKNRLFLSNKNEINEYLNKGNEKVIEDSKEPVKVESAEDILTINDVHNMTLEEVDQIITDIGRDKSFGIERPKVLAKRYTNFKNNDQNKE